MYFEGWREQRPDKPRKAAALRGLFGRTARQQPNQVFCGPYTHFKGPPDEGSARDALVAATRAWASRTLHGIDR